MSEALEHLVIVNRKVRMMDFNKHLWETCLLYFLLAFLTILTDSSDFFHTHQFAPNAERRIRERILLERNYSARERPVLSSADPLNVTIGVFLHAMLHLNQKDQTVKTASWVAFTWRDPRLVWDPSEFEGQDLISLHHDEVWLPSVNLGNGLETVSVIDPTQGWVVLSSNGEIYLGSAFIQSSYCPIRIKYFPFDSQTCVLKFNSQNVPSEKVFFKAGNAIISKSLSPSEWDIISMNGSHRIFNEINVISNRPLLPFSQVRFCLHITRYPRYYVILLIIPSTILNVMALMTFFSPPDGGERISLSISMILGLTVFQLLVADMLPVTREEDTPVLSIYLISNFLLAVLAIPFSLFTVNVMYSGFTPHNKETLLQKFISILIPVLCCLKLLKKSEKMTGKVDTQPGQARFISLPSTGNDVRENPTVNNQTANTLEEDKNHKDVPTEVVESPLQEIKDTRLIANALDRLFFLLFLFTIVVMFITLMLQYHGVGDYHHSTECQM